MAKFDVRVGEAFPVDEEPGKAAREARGRRHGCGADRDWGEWREPGYHLFRATVILLVIWGALALFGGGGPNGLLIAAAITFGVGVTHRLFPGRRRRRWSEAR